MVNVETVPFFFNTVGYNIEVTLPAVNSVFLMIEKIWGISMGKRFKTVKVRFHSANSFVRFSFNTFTLSFVAFNQPFECR